MEEISFKNLEQKIIEIFTNQNKYQLDKYIRDFSQGGNFLGDFWVYLMFEPKKDTYPIFYSVFTPYDATSKKAAYQALVFKNGETILNIPFKNYVNLRTGIMDSIVIRSLGISSLNHKKILYCGTGQTSLASLHALHEFFPEVHTVDFINTRGKDSRFELYAKKLEIDAVCSNKKKISEYDYIFCHTSSGAGTIFTENYLEKIKPGAILTTFVSTNGNTEFAEKFFNTNIANIIIDWEESIKGTKELQEAINLGLVDRNKVVLLEDLFSRKASLNPKAKYTLYRSTGTPMQNLAVLKLLLETSSF